MQYKLTQSRKGWKAEWWEGRKHRSATFKTEQERSDWVKDRTRGAKLMASMAKQAQRAGDYVSRFSRLGVEEQGALLGALDTAKAHGGDATLVWTLAREWVEHSGAAVTVGEAVEAHVEEVRRTRTKGTAKERAWELGALVRDHGELPLWQLTRGVCNAWVKDVPTASRERHRFAALSALLRDCVRRDWLKSNPMEGLRKPADTVREDVRIFSPEEAERILRKAEEQEPKMVPFFAVGLFAGLRPQRELRELDGRDVDVDGGQLYVRWRTVKTHQSRSVPLSENLQAWLRRYPVGERMFWNRYAYARVLDAAKVEWSQDVMRHTRASYRLALTRDPVLVADEMGHNVAVLKRHYANRRIPAADVEAFWGIMPSPPAE